LQNLVTIDAKYEPCNDHAGNDAAADVRRPDSGVLIGFRWRSRWPRSVFIRLSLDPSLLRFRPAGDSGPDIRQRAVERTASDPFFTFMG
jgi:hypothetical protein